MLAKACGDVPAGDAESPGKGSCCFVPMCSAAVASVSQDMPLSGHVLTFVLTCVTDLALIPPLLVMSRYRRHSVAGRTTALDHYFPLAETYGVESIQTSLRRPLIV